MADPLEKLLGSSARVKLLRLFLFNPKVFYTVPDAAARARATERTVRKEINLFNSVKLVRRASTRKRSGARFGLNSNFRYLAALQALLLNTPAREEDIYERLRKAGSIKLLVLSGMFVNEWDGTLDLMIVGDRIKESKLRAVVKKLESELGKELRYALLSTDNFMYRLNMSDKLVRDVLDYPHKIAFDRLNIGLK
ncbi:hypothetical protein KW798_02490 [Candidatus Parcubacteria bacterium]|nr:hypothetical protein [Candidatus Parcubacteria bacterium]